MLAGVVAVSVIARCLGPARAQQDAAPAAAPPCSARPTSSSARAISRARRSTPSIPPLPDSVAELDFDAWRDIRFKIGQTAARRAERQISGSNCSISAISTSGRSSINVLRDGIPAPIPYASNLFDYGHNKIAGALPVNLGFAGFRLQYPLNAPHVMDEVIAFLGASYFRFLGRGQRYGLSARGLAIGAGARTNEEFPFFREFWIETPDAAAPSGSSFTRLLDGESATGAFRFEVVPGWRRASTSTSTLFARRAIAVARTWRRCRRCSSPARTTIASSTISAPNCTIPTGC